ncbi:glycosyltransferase [Brevibacillus reuszeri]|uniref:glycosyltransferase n=1 Tax=Brevibacillus reuszeri TaxID=54915 RepID=UPI00289A8A9E|nr:glycosyltransferase [Brevibacillus reuszeri]
MRGKFMKSILIVLCLALLGSPLSVQAKEGSGDPPQQQQGIKPKEIKLQGDMRRAWIDHVIWIRAYIVSALAGLKDQDKVLARLMKNQEDIGNIFKPYYGEEASNKLTALLKEHISIAGKIVEATKKNRQADLKKYNAEWYKNADDIAKFLSSANPNWTEQELKDLLYKHLELLTEMIQARAKKDWDGDIAAFDKGEDHIITLADVLTEGIIKQFPNQF